MASIPLAPRCIRANVKFEADLETFEVENTLINKNGMPGIPWSRFKPREWVGRRTNITIHVLCATPYEIECQGFFTCEETETSCFIGLQFLLETEDLKKIEETIRTEGTLPHYVRKYPRIPFQESLRIMPARAVMILSSATKLTLISWDIDNLSPTGLQISTEDKRALQFVAGVPIFIRIMPRGNFLDEIELQCMVKRIVYNVSPRTGNIKFLLGLHILSVPIQHKEAFVSMLRMIVSEIQAEAA